MNHFIYCVELPFEPGDHRLLLVLLAICGAFVGYIHLHEHRGTLTYHLPWWYTTSQLIPEVMQVKWCFYWARCFLRIMEEITLNRLWGLQRKDMRRRATTDKNVCRDVGYHILVGADILSDEHYSTIKKRYTCWQNPIPNWMLTDWHMLEINTNNNVVLAVSDENHTPWRFAVVHYTLLVPHSIVAHGGTVLHTQHLGHPARTDCSTYICATCQHLGTRIPLSMLLC